MIPGQYLDEKSKIESEIQKLEKEVEALQARHRGPALDAIVKAMQEYDISPEDIAQAFRKGSKPARRSTRIAPKYMNPASGQTWSGRGRTPRWMAEAEARGEPRERFLIENAAQS